MKHAKVVRARRKLLREFPPLSKILRGTLLERRIFHKRGCLKCARGEGHSAWILTVSYGQGRTRQFSIRPEQRQQVASWLKNYQTLKEGLERICELNHELLRPER